MNYFDFHIGDYAAATQHLSDEEDLAYRRLLDAYYRDERPIPADIRQACRLARARTDAMREAVETVLREFFTETPDGWRSKRADETIERHRAFIERQRANGKNTAAKRWGSQAGSTGIAAATESVASATPPLSTGYSTGVAVGLPPTSHLPPPTSHLPPPTSHSVLRTEEEQNSTDTASVAGPSATPPADDAPKAKRKSKPEDRGTRIPDPFVLTSDMRAWATAEVPGIDAVAATREFVDYWRDVPGQRGRKVSWVGTWKNRMREVYAKRRPLNGHTPKPSSVDADGIPTWATAEERAELLRLREQETARADH